MTKIRALTTFRNEKHFDGTTSAGEVYTVEDEYAKQVVEEKGYAEYVEVKDEPEKTIRGDFPQGFLDEDIPPAFPNEKIRKTIAESGFRTFGDLLSIPDFTEIKGISEKQDDVLNESIPVALSAWKDKNL